jgi:REP element-mobilizing transposase RayT
MGIPKKYKAPFEENELYHVYNRTNNKEPLFIEDADRHLFLNRFFLYTTPFLETFSWNLLQNHFHLYVRVKPADEIINYLSTKHKKDLCSTEIKFLNHETTLHKLIDNTFKRLFISYATCFNTTYGRKGNLFHRPFKHVVTEHGDQFSKTIIYINANAIKHKLVMSIEDHKWSSYHTIISEKPTTLLKKEILDWFGGKAKFMELHKDAHALLLTDVIIDEL